MDLREDLKALREALPFGAIQRISDELGRTRQHVNDVFNGRYEDQKVIDVAIKEVEAENDRKKSISKRIREVLTQAS